MQKRLAITLPGRANVSGVLDLPAEAKACYVFAHGAGAGMEHAFMSSFAQGLRDRGIATLRFQFPYMEHGSRRPDTPAIAHAAVRAAVVQAAFEVPDLPLFAGGKSYGGRMSSQAQAREPLPNVRGLAFLGFPLHPAGKPSTSRADHLTEVKVPMLFLQGTRDTLAQLDLISQIARSLERRATLHIIEGADHSFHVPARSGRSDEQVRTEILDVMSSWMRANAG
jgi:predicted alpha/beta-hydrolase family hydrolase